MKVVGISAVILAVYVLVHVTLRTRDPPSCAALYDFCGFIAAMSFAAMLHDNDDFRQAIINTNTQAVVRAFAPLFAYRWFWIRINVVLYNFIKKALKLEACQLNRFLPLQYFVILVFAWMIQIWPMETNLRHNLAEWFRNFRNGHQFVVVVEGGDHLPPGCRGIRKRSTKNGTQVVIGGK